MDLPEKIEEKSKSKEEISEQLKADKNFYTLVCNASNCVDLSDIKLKKEEEFTSEYLSDGLTIKDYFVKEGYGVSLKVLKKSDKIYSGVGDTYEAAKQEAMDLCPIKKESKLEELIIVSTTYKFDDDLAETLSKKTAPGASVDRLDKDQLYF